MEYIERSRQKVVLNEIIILVCFVKLRSTGVSIYLLSICAYRLRACISLHNFIRISLEYNGTTEDKQFSVSRHKLVTYNECDWKCFCKDVHFAFGQN